MTALLGAFRHTTAWPRAICVHRDSHRPMLGQFRVIHASPGNISPTSASRSASESLFVVQECTQRNCQRQRQTENASIAPWARSRQSKICSHAKHARQANTRTPRPVPGARIARRANTRCSCPTGRTTARCAPRAVSNPRPGRPRATRATTASHIGIHGATPPVDTTAPSRTHRLATPSSPFLSL